MRNVYCVYCKSGIADHHIVEETASPMEDLDRCYCTNCGSTVWVRRMEREQ